MTIFAKHTTDRNRRPSKNWNILLILKFRMLHVYCIHERRNSTVLKNSVKWSQWGWVFGVFKTLFWIAHGVYFCKTGFSHDDACQSKTKGHYQEFKIFVYCNSYSQLTRLESFPLLIKSFMYWLSSPSSNRYVLNSLHTVKGRMVWPRLTSCLHTDVRRQ